MHDIDKYLKHRISNDITTKRLLRKDEDDESEYSLIIRANNTMKSEIKCAYRINFTKPHNNESVTFCGLHDSFLSRRSGRRHDS